MSQQPCLPLGPQQHRRRGRRRKRENASSVGDAGENTDAVVDDPTTISDLAGLDAVSYLSSVRRQAKGLPDVFVHDDQGGAEGRPSSRLKRTESTKKNGEGVKDKVANCKVEEDADKNDAFVPIDGSAATLRALLSPRLSLPSPPSSACLPARGPDWAKKALNDFEKLRSYVFECKKAAGIGCGPRGAKDGKGKTEMRRKPVPAMKDRGGWHEFCLGKNEAMGNTGGYFDDDDSDGDGGDRKDSAVEKSGGVGDDNKDSSDGWSLSVPPGGHSPTTSLLLQFDQILVRRLLSHHTHFLVEGWELTPGRAAWLYALLSRLEAPVHRDDAAVLRELLRECCQRRAASVETSVGRSSSSHAGEGGVGSGGNGREKEETLAALNILIAVVGVFFGQGGRMEDLYPDFEMEVRMS